MMKIKNIYFLALIWTVATLSDAKAQDTRTVETKVADVLALFPANTNPDADRLFRELMALDEEGLKIITARVVPNGKEEGVAPRYAVSLLTHHAATKQEKSRIEDAYLAALANAGDTEVKAYFIDNLKVIGTDASVEMLAEKINEEGLTDQAISALVSINSAASRAALASALENSKDEKAQARLIQALGELKDESAAPAITGFASSENILIKKQALWSLALIAHADSYNVLLQQAKTLNFKNDPAEATHALVEYIHQLEGKGNRDLIVNISQEILTNTLAPEQQHFRLAALRALTKTSPGEATKTLVKEMNRFDPGYQKEILKIASLTANGDSALKMWTKAYKKSNDLQGEILAMLASVNRNDEFIESTLVPALKSKSSAVRMVAAEEIAYSKNTKFRTDLNAYLLSATSDDEVATAKTAVLRMVDKAGTRALAEKFETAGAGTKAAILDILSERRAVEHFDLALRNTESADPGLRRSAFAALPNLASRENTGALLALLSREMASEDEIRTVQSALIESFDKKNSSLVNDAYEKNKAKILPLLPFVEDPEALNKVTTAFQSGSDREKVAAFEALVNWQDHEAVRTMLAIRKNGDLKKYHEKAFRAFVSQVGASSLPDDQKLLMYDEAMTLAEKQGEKTAIIRAVGNLRSFLALMFVSRYLDDKDLNRVASRSVMQIALPTADARPGLTGNVVRNILQKILDKLEGQDSQYEVIDIQTYLANMPHTRGFEPIFNGKDLSGWQGLVENPIVRAGMSKQELAKKQQEANEKLKESWSVKDGAIYFTGKGSNLCTIKPYGDFEMLVDWKISKDGDSGIYLRGSPQVQIWDPTGNENARVGSGGLFNNKKHRSTPLTVADNPVGEWNTFHIKMVGDLVTVHLNGVLVVDNVVMENYWDRNIPIFPEEAIELQAHGNELAFRNIYVKELGGKPYELTADEKQGGFELLFNSKDLDNWVGNKTDYVVEDNALAIYPTGKGSGNLYTEKEYSDFIFRFEFQLTPGANNGLGIHSPLSGDAAYGGKEIQILDNTAPVYANLKPYQYHGSVYGIIPAKRGFLKPVGEWNQQEVHVRGDRVKVTLNGTVILDGDLKEATKNGAMDKKEHPGLTIKKGHIGFLGHGTVVRFRNIRVKDLSAMP